MTPQPPPAEGRGGPVHEESSAPGTGTGDWPFKVVHCRRQGRMGRSGTPPTGVCVGGDAVGAASQARRWEEKGAARARRVGWKGRAPHGGELRRRQSGGVMDVVLSEGTGDEQTLPLTQEAWRQVNHRDRDPAVHCGRICVVGSRKYMEELAQGGNSSVATKHCRLASSMSVGISLRPWEVGGCVAPPADKRLACLLAPLPLRALVCCLTPVSPPSTSLSPQSPAPRPARPPRPRRR